MINILQRRFLPCLNMSKIWNILDEKFNNPLVPWDAGLIKLKIFPNGHRRVTQSHKRNPYPVKDMD